MKAKAVETLRLGPDHHAKLWQDRNDNFRSSNLYPTALFVNVIRKAPYTEVVEAVFLAQR